MATEFHLEIVTPERVLYSGRAEEVSMRAIDGEIAFLANHEDYIGAADITVVRVAAPDGAGESGELRVAVHGGFVHVDQDENSVTILAGVAELAAEIDVDRARRALDAANARLAEGRGVRPDEAGEEGATAAGRLADTPESAARRARVRLEAAGATVGA